MRNNDGCPVCGGVDDHIYEGCTYWVVCSKHKFKLAYLYDGQTRERYMCPECQAAAEILEYWNCGVFDFEEAHKRFRKEAKQNCAEAQFHLGIFYRYGLAVPKDEVEAAKWIRKAAEQNSAKAQFNLGICYRYGLGVPKNEVEAAKWFSKAVRENCAEPQFNLGICFRGVVFWQDFVAWRTAQNGAKNGLKRLPERNTEPETILPPRAARILQAA